MWWTFGARTAMQHRYSGHDGFLDILDNPFGRSTAAPPFAGPKSPDRHPVSLVQLRRASGQSATQPKSWSKNSPPPKCGRRRSTPCCLILQPVRPMPRKTPSPGELRVAGVIFA